MGYALLELDDEDAPIVRASTQGRPRIESRSLTLVDNDGVCVVISGPTWAFRRIFRRTEENEFALAGLPISITTSRTKPAKKEPLREPPQRRRAHRRGPRTRAR